jgi:N6-L-threonylcarbamoyladenine synthase
MKEKAGAENIDAFFPAPKFCTDNGAMIALTGYEWLKRGRRDGYRLNADADLTL